VAKVDAVSEEIVAAGGVAETAQVDALDETAVEEHLNAVVEKAGGLDISFNAVGPGPAPERTPLTELAADAFVRPIAFYTQFQLHHRDRRRPAHERPGLRCDRDTDSRSRPDAGSSDRRCGTGLGRR
jgi:NAD(P)-dependent dehydrogenase (short-subunit alcohol dehydrogenase family)